MILKRMIVTDEARRNAGDMEPFEQCIAELRAIYLGFLEGQRKAGALDGADITLELRAQPFMRQAPVVGSAMSFAQGSGD